MERHLSTGVATIVALMAEHRAASTGRTARVYSQDEVAHIEALLKRWSPLGLRFQDDAIAINSHLQKCDASL
jgi:hypothetical protein